MKVYIVHRGCYSDRSICAVCSTMELAQEASRLLAAENDIEEHDVDIQLPHPVGLYPYGVCMGADGFVEMKGEWCLEGDDPTFEWSPVEHTWWSRAKARRRMGLVLFVMWARDEGHAVKIANERRTMLLASGEWTTDVKEFEKRDARLKKRVGMTLEGTAELTNIENKGVVQQLRKIYRNLIKAT